MSVLMNLLRILWENMSIPFCQRLLEKSCLMKFIIFADDFKGQAHHTFDILSQRVVN